MRLKQLFFALLIRPLLLFVSGIRVRGMERLPAEGPALLVANHNSHLDTLALMSLFPLRALPRVRPVAARDYFFATPLRRFAAQKLIGILPLERERVKKSAGHPLDPLARALDKGDILILYPEGSRGKPGKLRPFKSGFAHLAKIRPEVPVIPVKISGTDRSLPKDEALWVPFVIEIEILEPMRFHGNVRDFVRKVESLYNTPKETP